MAKELLVCCAEVIRPSVIGTSSCSQLTSFPNEKILFISQRRHQWNNRHEITQFWNDSQVERGARRKQEDSSIATNLLQVLPAFFPRNLKTVLLSLNKGQL